MSDYRALIAVVAYHLDGRRVTRWPDGGYGAPAPYLDALRRAGARTLLVPPGEDVDPGVTLEPFDGLLLVGGGDVDPATYDAEPDTAHNYGVEPDRDALEIALLHEADRLHMPVLCVCRGMQVMNAAFGGTLHQHLPNLPGLLEHGVPMEGTETIHEVEPVPGTLLSAATKARSLACSSHHHQGVDRVGERLRVCGRAPDELIEAIELEGADMNDPATTWMLGVQWHPEETAANDLSQQRLFDALVQIARFKGQRPRAASAARRSRPYEVVPYEAAWPGRFDAEAARIRDALPQGLVASIEHVGSTAVPGLPAKPIVDIQLSVTSMIPVEAYAGPLRALGYRHVLDPWNDDHEFFSLDEAAERTTHVHACAAGSSWERDHIAFRDRLRSDAVDREAYGQLKERLAAEHPEDLVSYLEGKDPMIADILARAYPAGSSGRLPG